MKPHLNTHSDFDARNPEEGLLSVELKNMGIGPAVISGFDVFHDGEPCEFSSEIILSLLESIPAKISVKITTFQPGRAVAVGEAHYL